MANTLYKIVFEGQLRNGVDSQTARLNLARLFKSEPSAVEKLFNGNPIALKRGLTQADADAYIQALNEAGVEARVEPDLAISLRLDEIKSAPEQVASSESAWSSPYAPPKASVTEQTWEYAPLNVFGIQGRLGRLRYLAWMLVLMAASVMVLGACTMVMGFTLIGGGLLMTVASAAAFVVLIQIGVRRLHDMGWSGWLLLLNVLPYIGTIFFLLMVLIPGNKGVNRYGAPPPPNSRSIKVLAVVWLLLIALGFISGLSGGLDVLQEQLDATTAEYEQSLPYDDPVQKPGPDTQLEDDQDQ
ncbi:membrane protein [Paucimonas lemoignei]|nr:membrane protein [Paucimonas lemoignei]